MRGTWQISVLAALCAGLAACTGERPKAAAQPSPPRQITPPKHGAYLGAYLDLGEAEDELTLEKIENFEKLTGRKLAVVACSSFWGEQSFPKRQVEIIALHQAIPLIYWSPWDRPYEQDHGPDRFSLPAILQGRWDAYIDRWADAAKASGHPLLAAWGLEMNGTWFPWSGTFYGGGKEVSGKTNAWEGPETYKAAYRYVVDRVRARGADNVRWVFHANNYSYPLDDWNALAAYYPGDGYVDWLGLSVYGKQFAKDSWANFADLMDYPYREIGALAPDKPILLAEWGIGEFPQAGDKGAWIRDAMRQMSTKYPRLKAAVFWHERWENEDGSYSNLRVNSSPGALEAYRKGIANSFWRDHPE